MGSAAPWVLARSCCECSVPCAAAPGIIILLAGVILPESPSSLAEQNEAERARKVRTHAHLAIGPPLTQLAHIARIQ